MSGPVPKRSEERRRRNKTAIDKPAAKVARVVIPGLPKDTHPIARRIYNALKKSGQSEYFEPSDWARALLFCDQLTKYLTSKKPSTLMYMALQKDMADLLVTEADRRRVHMEVQRDQDEPEGVSLIDEYRARLKAKAQ